MLKMKFIGSLIRDKKWTTFTREIILLGRKNYKWDSEK